MDDIAMKTFLLATVTAAAVLVSASAYADPIDPVLVDQRWKAFFYVALLRHETYCPMQRSAAFKATRAAMLAQATQDASGVPSSVIAWTHEDQFDKYRATPGPLCRLITQLITDQQIYQQRLTSE
jgi:hypothetical protein